MEKNSLLNVYDHAYASRYNHQFLLNPFSRVSADFELNVLQGLINNDTLWLDTGCGTGYFLSQFKGYKRAGMDISPAMLEEAGKVNPDALFFKQADFREDVPEWHNKWSLVTCMWYPYSYVESINEVECVIQNIINWTQSGGDVFIPVADLEDLRPFVSPVPYEDAESVYGGTLKITGYTWSWIEEGGKKAHINMVAPHFDHILRLVEPFFEVIDILRYPPAYEGWVSRRAILAKKKCGDPRADHKAKVIRHPVPPPANRLPQSPAQEITKVNPLEHATQTQLFKEVFKRVRNGHMLRSLFRKLFSGRSSD